VLPRGSNNQTYKPAITYNANLFTSLYAAHVLLDLHVLLQPAAWWSAAPTT
jgi:hypothetical protein